MNEKDPQEIGLLTAFTLMLWLLCAAVGIAGLFLQPSSPAPPATQPTALGVQVLTVDMINEPQPLAVLSAPPDMAPPPSSEIPPAAAASPALSPEPQWLALAAPIPAIAFVQPIDGPSRRVPAKQATPVAAEPVVSQNAVRQLTFGQGEGQQPSPEYPIESQLSRQTGTVVIRFAVGENGRVTSAEAISPCPWPLLNQSALRKVREAWRFPIGPPRTYEIAIDFVLKKR